MWQAEEPSRNHHRLSRGLMKSCPGICPRSELVSQALGSNWNYSRHLLAARGGRGGPTPSRTPSSPAEDSKEAGRAWTKGEGRAIQEKGRGGQGGKLTPRQSQGPVHGEVSLLFKSSNGKRREISWKIYILIPLKLEALFATDNDSIGPSGRPEIRDFSPRLGRLTPCAITPLVPWGRESHAWGLGGNHPL